MTKRLFLAINLPSEIKSALDNIVFDLQKNNSDKPIKWVEKDNFHLTLHFLGDTPEEKITDINEALAPIVAKYRNLNFQLSENVNAFPNLIEPNVIFLDMKELNDGQAIKLQSELGKALNQLGFAIDQRPFRLHLTLGRVKFNTAIQIPSFQLKTTNFQINSIDLMSSDLNSTGPIYSIIKNYPLS